MEDKWVLLSKVIVRLNTIGVSFKSNRIMKLNVPVKGYQRVTLDIGILNKDDKVISAFYIGPRKERRIQKYKILKIPVYYIHDEKEMNPVMERFMNEYTQMFF